MKVDNRKTGIPDGADGQLEENEGLVIDGSCI